LQKKKVLSCSYFIRLHQLDPINIKLSKYEEIPAKTFARHKQSNLFRYNLVVVFITAANYLWLDYGCKRLKKSRSIKIFTIFFPFFLFLPKHGTKKCKSK